MNTDAAEPPVVLLHGLATSADRTWRETGWIDVLGDTGRRVVAPPLPGHDGPDAPTEPDAYVGFEAQVAALLPEGPIDAVGFSLGARTLLVLAAAEPTRFRRLVVAGVGDNLFRRDGSSAVLAAALESLAAGRADDEAAANPMVRHFATLASSCGVSLGALSALLRRPDPPDVTPELLAACRFRCASCWATPTSPVRRSRCSTRFRTRCTCRCAGSIISPRRGASRSSTQR